MRIFNMIPPMPSLSWLLKAYTLFKGLFADKSKAYYGGKFDGPTWTVVTGRTGAISPEVAKHLRK